MIKFPKPICVVVIIALLLQSCAIYQRQPVSIEEASKTNRRVLLITDENKKIRLKSIEKNDSVFHGIVNSRLRQKVLLDQSKIKALRPINRTATTLGNVGFVTLGALTLVVIIFALTYEPTYELNFGEETLKP